MCYVHFGQHGLYVHVIKFHIPLSSISAITIQSTLVNPVTLGTVQLGRNSEVAVFREIAAA